MRKNFIIYRLSVFIFLFFSFAKTTAQALPQDSISIRKDFSLPNPTRYEAFYDVETGMYFLYPKMGNTVIGAPTVMTVREYQDYVMSSQLADYYREKSANYNVIFRKDQTEAQKKGLIPAVLVKNK